MKWNINKTKYKPLISLLTFTLIAIVFYLVTSFLFNKGYLDNIVKFAQDKYYLFLFILFLIKLVGIIFPPIPGGGFVLASVPIIGWPTAYLIDASGSIIGGIFNYHIAKKYGISFISKTLGPKSAERVKSIKIKEGREIESILILRLLMGAVILEFIHYAAGILDIKFRKYFMALIISQVVIGVPMFYFFDVIVTGEFKLAFAMLVILAIPLLYLSRKRYIS